MAAHRSAAQSEGPRQGATVRVEAVRVRNGKIRDTTNMRRKQVRVWVGGCVCWLGGGGGLRWDERAGLLFHSLIASGPWQGLSEAPLAGVRQATRLFPVPPSLPR